MQSVPRFIAPSSSRQCRNTAYQEKTIAGRYLTTWEVPVYGLGRTLVLVANRLIEKNQRLLCRLVRSIEFGESVSPFLARDIP